MSRLFYTTKAKARAYDAVIGVFNEIYKETKSLGGKKPEATLNAAKIKMMNRVLSDACNLLEGEDTHKYLDLLDSDDLPQYSDALIIMSQYEGALKTFRERHFGYFEGEHQWALKG